MKNFFCILSTVNRLIIMEKVGVYLQRSDISVHILLQQWYNYQKEPGDDVVTHIVKLENLVHRLQTSLDKKIPNQMIITKILMILSPSFKYFISAWELTQSNERTLTNLISKLIIEETRAETEEYTGRKGEAFIGAMFVKYNLQYKHLVMHDTQIRVRLNTCQVIASGSRHIKNSTQQRILRQAIENIFK